MKPKLPGKSRKAHSGYQPFVPAVDQASRVLLCLAASSNSKLRLTDICEQVGIHKSKGHAILNTLALFDLVEKDPQTKLYSLGPALLFLSRNLLDNFAYPEIVAPFLQTLAKETNGTALFGLVHGDHVFVIAKNEGDQNVGVTLRLGHRFHITLGAHGKAVVAFMSEEERQRILGRKKLHFYGQGAPPADMKRLKEELAQCRACGFAWDLGRVTPGVHVLSSPVFGLHQKVIGCLILVGTFMQTKIEEFGPKMVAVAKQISYRLGADTESLYPKNAEM